jgi:hypothetical protein
VHYFLKEINYFDIDEETARQVTAHFKDSSSQLNGDISAAELLLRIARDEFHLQKISNAPTDALQIVQRMDKRNIQLSKSQEP